MTVPAKRFSSHHHRLTLASPSRTETLHTGETGGNDVLQPPTVCQTRVFQVCELAKGHTLTFEDLKGAYLQKDYRGPPLFVRLPFEFETGEGKAMLAKGGIPVRRVRKAAYGLPRAGADYWAGVDKDLQSFGWKSMRSLADGSPSQYYREYTPS